MTRTYHRPDPRHLVLAMPGRRAPPAHRPRSGDGATRVRPSAGASGVVVTRAEAKRFACYLLAADLSTSLGTELVSARVGGADEDRVNVALRELLDELLRRAGVDEWSGDPQPSDLGIRKWTPPPVAR